MVGHDAVFAMPGLLLLRPECLTSCEPYSTPATSSPEGAVRRADHTASFWLDLAEGRLRLDRLSRNGGGSTFFPWAEAHSSRNKKLSPTPSSAALRPARGASSIASGFPIAIEAAAVAGYRSTRNLKAMVCLIAGKLDFKLPA